MHKKLLYFDIDNTLINTRKYNWYKCLSIISKKDYKECVIRSVASELETLSKKYKLGIFSQGFYKVQIKKIQTTELYKFFDENEIYIKPLNKKTALKDIVNKHPDKSDLIFVDDNKRIYRFLKEKGINCILIQKNNENNFSFNL